MDKYIYIRSIKTLFSQYTMPLKPRCLGNEFNNYIVEVSYQQYKGGANYIEIVHSSVTIKCYSDQTTDIKIQKNTLKLSGMGK